MLKIEQGKQKLLSKIMIVFTLIFVMTFVFNGNLICQNDEGFFDGFQQDSEAYITGAVFADRFEINTNGTGFVKINSDGSFNTYATSYALQGRVFSLLYNTVGLRSFFLFSFLCCLTLSVTLTCLCLLLREKYGTLFGTVFYLVFLLSPWVTAMARNLYWLEFLFFLPAVFSLFLLRRLRSGKLWWPFLIPIFFILFIKSLCGYEYMSSIMLFTVVFPFVDFIVTKDKKYRMKLFLALLGISIMEILGFFAAFLIHAYMINPNIAIGIKQIWVDYVLRRMLGGNAMNYEPSLTASLIASPIEVIRNYLFFFPRDIIPGVSGKLFPLLIATVMITLIYYTIKNKKIVSANNILFIVLFLTPFSWFLLGKAHSYVHPHINYILWYLGFIPFCFYILVKPVYEFVMVDDKKKANLREIRAQLIVPSTAAKCCFVIIALTLICNLMTSRSVLLYNNEKTLTRAEKLGQMLYKDEDTKIFLFEDTIYTFEEKYTRDNSMYFLHLIPKDKKNLAEDRQEYGFDNFDFDFITHEMQLPFGYRYEVASQALPSYPILEIEIGQYNGGGELWGGKVVITE